MRILAVADIHGYPRGEAAVRRLAGDTGPDAIAIAGDLTGRSGLRSTRELLSGLAVPALVIPGNMDGDAAAASFTVGLARNIDMGSAVLGGFTFVGLGGVSAPAAERRGNAGELAAIERRLEGLFSPPAVLLTHVPPFGRLDSVPVPPSFSGGSGMREHIGSHFIRRLVERFRPALVISGHVHEDRGIERDGDTLYVNPGPARDGFGALIELGARPGARLLETKA